MKRRFLLATAIVLILLSLPALVLAEGPVPSTGPSGDGLEGGAPPLESPANTLWDQPSDGYSGIVDQYFPDYIAGVYSADDFSNAEPWNIESIFVDGQMSIFATGNLLNANSLNWRIYPDAAGVPAGYPDVGGEVWSYSCLPSDPEVTLGGANNDDITLDIVQAQGSPLHLPPGTYWLCFYPSLSFFTYGQWFWDTAGTSNLAIAQVIDPAGLLALPSTWTPWTVIDASAYDAAFRLEGTVPYPSLPPNVKYLHSTGGLFNLTEPLGTQWHELWPIFCREYHLSSWEDNGDGVLSYCDTINMYEKPDGELRPYHVEEVTITLVVAPTYAGTAPPPSPDEFMYIELVGGYNETALGEPVYTLWHEIYPNFCTTYNFTGWDDNGSLVLDYCDSILLENLFIREGGWWHVEEVAIDIVVTPEPPPVGVEAYPVSKASLLAPWIAVGAAIAAGAGVLVLRKRRT